MRGQVRRQTQKQTPRKLRRWKPEVEEIVFDWLKQETKAGKDRGTIEADFEDKFGEERSYPAIYAKASQHKGMSSLPYIPAAPRRVTVLRTRQQPLNVKSTVEDVENFQDGEDSESTKSTEIYQPSETSESMETNQRRPMTLERAETVELREAAGSTRPLQLIGASHSAKTISPGGPPSTLKRLPWYGTPHSEHSPFATPQSTQGQWFTSYPPIMPKPWPEADHTGSSSVGICAVDQSHPPESRSIQASNVSNPGEYTFAGSPSLSMPGIGSFPYTSIV